MRLPVLYIVFGTIVGTLFKDQIENFGYLKEVFIAIFGIALVDFILRKIRLKRKRLLVRTIYDSTYQITNIVLSVLLSVLVIKTWIPDSYFHYYGVFFAALLIISGIFYENSIQITVNKTGLLIDYKYKKKRQFSSIDKIEIEKSIIRIFEEDTVIEVNDLRDNIEDRRRIFSYLSLKLSHIDIIIK